MSHHNGTVPVTGGTTGLGYEASLSIAQSHPKYRIIVASRIDTDSAAVTINKTTRRESAV